MNFYFNEELCMCASEWWVADYLFMAGEFESREDAIEELQGCRAVHGWYACSVSENIEEACWSKFVKEKTNHF